MEQPLTEDNIDIVNAETVEYKKLNGVPVPEVSIPVDTDRAREWIRQETDPRFRALKEKLLKHLHHVSFEEFQESLSNSISKLNTRLPEGTNYAVLWDYKPHSSRRWIYELAKTELVCKPTVTSYIGGKSETHDDFPVFRSLDQKGITTFVVFDDAVYSGEQMINTTITPLFEYYKRHKLGERPKMIIVTPYVTNRFLKAIAIPIKFGVIEVIYQEIMPELSEILSEEDWTLLDERGGGLELEEEKSPSAGVTPQGTIALSIEDDVLTNSTLTYFDHRVADAYSFCSSVRRPLELFAEAPYRNPNTEYYQIEEEEFKNFYNQLQNKRNSSKSSAI